MVDIIRGAIKIDGLPDGVCFKDFGELLKSLPKFLTIEIPTEISNVIVSNVQPNDDQRQNVWIRLGNDGGFVGIYIFALGKWQQITPVPQGVFWMYGDSRDVPDGYKLIDTGDPFFTPSELVLLKKQYIRDLTDTFYRYFASRWEGF